MLPPSAKLASWAVRYGPALLPLAQKLYDQGKFRQLAILHARTIVDGSFSWEMVDGERVSAIDRECGATGAAHRGRGNGETLHLADGPQDQVEKFIGGILPLRAQCDHLRPGFGDQPSPLCHLARVTVLDP